MVHFIKNKIDKFWRGVLNLRKWRYIIANDKWSDFIYILKHLEFKLKDIESHWGKDTDYENDYVDRDTLREIIKTLENMIELAPEIHNDNEKLEEYKKLSKSFFGRLNTLHIKLWD